MLYILCLSVYVCVFSSMRYEFSPSLRKMTTTGNCVGGVKRLESRVSRRVPRDFNSTPKYTRRYRGELNGEVPREREGGREGRRKEREREIDSTYHDRTLSYVAEEDDSRQGRARSIALLAV